MSKKIQSEDKILEEALGKFAEEKGKATGDLVRIGLNLKGAPVPRMGKSVAQGAREGAQIAARFLPTENKKFSFLVNEQFKRTNQIIQDFLKPKNKIIEIKNENKKQVIRGIVFSGFFDMNPALVEIILNPISPNRTEISISASAKEGLIKQHTSLKAIKKIARLFNENTNIL